MNPGDMNQALREAGLRPTLGRATVLKLMEEAAGAPRCCEDLYRSAMQAGRSLNVSSIAHALADLERAGCIERASTQEERRMYYRCPVREKPGPRLPVFLETGGQQVVVNDPLLALRLTRCIADHGADVAAAERIVVRLEAGSRCAAGPPNAPG